MITQRVRAMVFATGSALMCVACGLTGGTAVSTDGTTSASDASAAESTTTEQTAPTSSAGTTPAAAVAADSAARPETVAAVADMAVMAMQEQDWASLSELVGSDGLTISLDAYVDDDDLTVSSTEILDAGSDTTIRRWGTSEEPGVFFDATLAQQLEALVSIAAITDTEDTSVNERLGAGNIIDNLGDVFPTGEYKEFWNGGVNPAFDGLDWTSLRFVVVDGKLRALVQDQWAP